MKIWLTALILTVATLGAPTATHAAGGPELRVSQGAVKASGGRLKGFLVVRNAGGATSSRTTTQLIVTTSGGAAHVIERYLVLALKPGQTAQSDIDLPLPAYSGTVTACAPKPRDGHAVTNRCRTLGAIAPATAPVSSNPTDPIAYQPDQIFSVPDTVDGKPSNYWAVVPSSYDASKPMRLLIWLHGCGGQSEYEIEIGSPAVRGGSQDWITISPGGREAGAGDSGCWDAVNDQPKVYAALADVESHFNVDTKRVVIGGYSAGGDLSYRTAFDHSLRFAGVLAENTSPFRDTKQTQSQALGEAAWKFNLVHLAHSQDEVYHYAAVKQEVQAMVDAGFPVTFLTRPGTHYDKHTESDAETYLIPHMDDGWAAP